MLWKILLGLAVCAIVFANVNSLKCHNCDTSTDDKNATLYKKDCIDGKTTVECPAGINDTVCIRHTAKYPNVTMLYKSCGTKNSTCKTLNDGSKALGATDTTCTECTTDNCNSGEIIKASSIIGITSLLFAIKYLLI